MIKSGFITLITVLLLGAVVVAVTVTLLLLQIQNGTMTFTMKEALYARTYANSCAEEALQQLALNGTYSGMSTVTFPWGTCTYTVTQGVVRQVDAMGTSGTVQSHVRVLINDAGVTWSEIP